ncbi:MAG: acyl-CoA dehydrogenase family protein [Actinomycetota bacterium]|nr:acyl-CoA dehydrogenase family protein [Actinomycetota bacterium]
MSERVDDERVQLEREVNAWLDEHWDPDLTVEAWWRVVAAAGWTAPHLKPEEGGRGLSRRSGMHVRRIFGARGALRPPGGLGLLMAGPTILTHGTPDQIARHLPPILEGRLGWCQLFSEPGAGSDLAGLSTRAVRDGDRWIITGQKVWSSEARECDYGMLLARTDVDVPKHQGISWFAFKLDQPGVTIRPLREMTGDAVFNEIFIDEAVCDDADLIGGEGNGWAVTQTTLFFERSGIGAGGGHAGFPYPGPKGGMVGRLAGDAAQDPMPGGNLVLSLPDLISLARRLGRHTDPHVRQKLALLSTYTDVGLWNAKRGKAEAAKGGGSAVASIGKLVQTKIMKLSSEIALDILGADGMLAGESGTDGGRYTHAFVFSPASSIYGGADEIQRNIAAERTLGLPKEQAPDKGLTWAEAQRLLAKNTAD